MTAVVIFHYFYVVGNHLKKHLVLRKTSGAYINQNQSESILSGIIQIMPDKQHTQRHIAIGRSEMGSFLAISLWVALATVIPGLVTLAVLYGAYIIINPEFLKPWVNLLPTTSDLFWTALAITTMILTQAFGILLENVLVRLKLLGPRRMKIEIKPGIDPRGGTNIKIDPYDEYEGIYILLAELEENDDAQGHLKRCLAQFFLTNNTLVAFLAGILATIILTISATDSLMMIKGCVYFWILFIFLMVSFKVAKVRFKVMSKTLWAARRRRLPVDGKSKSDDIHDVYYIHQ